MMNRFLQVAVNNDAWYQEAKVNTTSNSHFTYGLAVSTNIILTNIIYLHYTVTLGDGNPQLRFV